MVIQFICRGNAFRSIIAEAYLRSLNLDGIEAISSGTVASKFKNLNLPSLPRTIAMLKRHGIDGYIKDHIGDDIDQSELDRSDIVIFLNKIAYAEVAETHTMPRNTFIWDVTDLGEKGRIVTSDAQRELLMEDVYIEIAKDVDKLVMSLCTER